MKRYIDNTLTSFSHQSRSYQSGFSIMELMISLVLGLIITLGILQVFINITGNYRQQSAVNHLNETGQYALTYLARDFTDIGFAGCLSNLAVAQNNINSAGTGYSSTYYTFTTPIQGAITQSGSTDLLQDTITVKGARAIGSGAHLYTPYPTTVTSNLTITQDSGSTATVFTGNGISQGQLLLVSDCQSGDIFQASNNDASSTGVIQHATGGGVNPGNSTASFSTVYGAMASVYSLYAYQYSINPTGSNGRPALIRTTRTGPQEIATNVSGFVIYYGVDTDGDFAANQYLRANNVTDFSKVVSVRFELLLSSPDDNVSQQKNNYYFNFTTVTPNDFRIYRVYTQTVAFRNRLK